jgi:SulP family sulfate permease
MENESDLGSENGQIRTNHMIRAVFADPGQYVKDVLSYDLMAGVTVAVMLIPQGMAYALLAGLPPIYGLYAALVPMVIYPFFGSSNYLSVGPVALVSIIVLTGLSEMAEPMSPEFIQLALLTSLLAGGIQVMLSVLRMGFLVNFLSHPVISGFTSAAAFIIGFSQLKHLFGINVQAGNGFLETSTGIISNLDQSNPTTVLLGVGALAVIVILKRVRKSIPGALIALVMSIIVVKFGSLDESGVQIVREVPSGLPSFVLPEISLGVLVDLLPLALVICLISFIESLAIAKTLGAKNGQFNIDANRELLGLGLAKIVGSFFQAFPNTGSFTRSAINEQAGARTGMASIFAAVIVVLTLMFFTGLFYYLPKAILASIVIAAVFGLIDVKEAIHLFKKDKRDFIVLLLTFVLTLALGIQNGVFVGVLLSLLFILQKASRPHYAVLGRLPESGKYRNIDRFDEAEVQNRQLIFRYDDDVFFGNAEHFFAAVVSELKARPTVKQLVLDLSAVASMDSTGIQQFRLLLNTVRGMGVEVHLCSVKGPLRDIFRKFGIDRTIDSDHIHWDVHDAMDSIGIGYRKMVTEQHND